MLEFALQAEQFRAKAAVCFARSKGLRDPEYRQIFYDLAIEWLAMAAEADFKKTLAITTSEVKIYAPTGPARKAMRLAVRSQETQFDRWMGADESASRDFYV
jgi:hypothetical protein